MSYLGYLVNINGFSIDPKIIAPNSYKAQSVAINILSKRDANGNEHIINFPKEKMEIDFVIKERTAAQQAQIAQIFKEKENLKVVWYDLVDAVYKTGSFRMEASELMLQTATEDSVYYAATQISLKEY